MVKKAEEENLVLATGHIERHNPAVAFVKEGIQKNRFGDVISLSSQTSEQSSWENKRCRSDS